MVFNLKGGKSLWVYNFQAELLKQGGEENSKGHHCSLPKSLGTQRMDAVTSHTPSKERKQQKVPELQNHKLISLPNKVMLKVIQNHISITNEELLAEEQTWLQTK